VPRLGPGRFEVLGIALDRVARLLLERRLELPIEGDGDGMVAGIPVQGQHPSNVQIASLQDIGSDGIR
jgi:hypothetical protein